MRIKNRKLDGKKILFIATSFFGYEIKMKEKMEELGADVVYYDERSITVSWQKALLKINTKIFKNRTKKYYHGIINKNKMKSFDYIYIYGATMIDKDIVLLIKKTFEDSKFILYLADSVLKNKRYENMFEFFDTVYSFDLRDYKYYSSRNSNFKFLPLFYCDVYRDKDENIKSKYDLSFVGTAHSDRLRIIKEIDKLCNQSELNTYFYCYLPSWFMYFYYKITDKSFKNTTYDYFEYKKKSSGSISEIISNSNAVLDIQYPKNTGLTMRTIEVLGMKKKLVTTNEDIANYDFYDKNNILIIDRNNIEIERSFFEKPYRDISKKIYDKYSLENWIMTLLGDDTK